MNGISNIKNKIIVMSGKGGVGKSTVSSNLAVSLMLKGYKVGILDVDIHGPSIPTIFGVENKKAYGDENGMEPICFGDNLKIISIGFFVDDMDAAIVWRGPAKANFIKQFIENVSWGELDYLVVDCPPGTGDEPLSVIQMMNNDVMGLVVTTPQKLAVADVRRSIDFCKKMRIPVVGVVENMSGFVCPECNKVVDVFKTGGGEKMANDMRVPFIGRIPYDKEIMESCDEGKPFLYYYSQTKTAEVMEKIIEPVLRVSKK
ncbi:MAG: Septum site-determining protein MinD [Alphaproteobacteria bacterium ADurb.Bin438]|nr:MAG: Septum site-determining protein MinD [Alphaproteobacteria bacterium ADurb.Bin438]